jgi:hypothetical protein
MPYSNPQSLKVGTHKDDSKVLIYAKIRKDRKTNAERVPYSTFKGDRERCDLDFLNHFTTR